MTIVPNKFPSIPQPNRIAIIGEAPGRDEEVQGEPFVGTSGRFLAALLGRAGTSKNCCFVGNISQHRPPGNEIGQFSWDGIEIQEGLTQLAIDIRQFNPNIVVLLGNTALKAAKDPDSTHPLKPGRFKFSVANWRGSLFECTEMNSPFFGRKCIASYHPAYVLRDYACAPVLQFDLKKAVRESLSPDLIIPQRNVIFPEDEFDVCEFFDKVKHNKSLIAVDIEGGIDTMSCISFAASDKEAIIIPFTNGIGGNYWNEELSECAIWKEMVLVLEDPTIPKVLQNSLYDRFVLQYSYDIVVRGVVDDTMLKHWELYCELEKGLGFQTSIYTNEPYYKHEIKSADLQTFWTYCCKDSCVTYEINQKLSPQLSDTSKEHYRFNVSLLPSFLYMELRGISYDYDKAQNRRAELTHKMYGYQAELDELCGTGLGKEVNAQNILDIVRENMCYKRQASLITCFKTAALYAKKDYVETIQRISVLVGSLESNVLEQSVLGELSTLCEKHLNVESPKQFCHLLYTKLGLPLQTHSQTEQPTTNYEALLKLIKKTENSSNPNHILGNKICKVATEIRSLATRTGMLSIRPDSDGRIRCGYNIVGSETGRITCYTSPTGSGYNLQTIPKYDRDLFVADEDHWLFQCDLAGADGWTVAAYCKMLGDSTMLDDYLFGLKPAKILTLMLRGTTVDYTNRLALKEACKAVSGDDWDYFACKRVQHGGCYLMGEIRMANQILTDSEGKFVIGSTECKQLKSFLFQRYPGILRWHDYTSRRLSQKPVIVSASGHRRFFFGRSNEILGEALAHEPQSNTTYATNLAAFKLWTDPDNRIVGETKSGMYSSPRLKIEPLHQVHDALVGQFAKADTQWATAKVKSYFNNALTIANQQITIPFEGAYGESWGNLKEGVI